MVQKEVKKRREQMREQIKQSLQRLDQKMERHPRIVMGTAAGFFLVMLAVAWHHHSVYPPF